ncbi:hypothetical protein [Nocardia miyunensis]|uniref:hypothetical protein n=1 Tax=Nocardia miyunensis TaxID=282684 RepID=UPI000AD0C79E|nr:hypothetical protein [Nocardia miyunensis]
MTAVPPATAFDQWLDTLGTAADATTGHDVQQALAHAHRIAEVHAARASGQWTQLCRALLQRSGSHPGDGLAPGTTGPHTPEHGS